MSFEYLIAYDAKDKNVSLRGRAFITLDRKINSRADIEEAERLIATQQSLDVVIVMNFQLLNET